MSWSPDLTNWFTSTDGALYATNATERWRDTGPPRTLPHPSAVTQRFYRVILDPDH